MVALEQILAAAVINLADAANIDGLLPELDFAPADVDVRIIQRGDDLRDGDIIGVEFLEIDLYRELLDRAAPGIDLHDAGHRHQPAGDDPVLNASEIGQAKVFRADDLIAIDLANQRGLLNDRFDAIGEFGVLLQGQSCLRIGEIIIHAIGESDLNPRQSVKRGRSDIGDVWHRIERRFQWHRIVFLHLLRRQSGRLRGDFDDDGRGIGIGLDV